MAADTAAEAGWTLRGFVRNTAGTAVHSFRRRIPAHDPEEGTVVNLFDRVRLRPGSYTVNAVLSSKAAVTPLATSTRVEIPPIPLDALFLVGPILGREADPVADTGLPRRERRGLEDLVRVPTSYQDARFEPLVVPQSAQGAPLASWTRVCFVPSDGVAGRGEVARHLHSLDGEPAGRFDPVELEFGPDSKHRCQDLVDGLPSNVLSPGDYRMTAVIDADRSQTAVTAPLTILPSE